MESISNSYAPAPNHRTFGRGAWDSGIGEPCREQCHYRWIGRFMSPIRRRGPMQTGPERDCPPKRSSIGPPMERRMAKNEPILGAMTRRIPDGETSMGSDGILFP